MDDFTYRDGQLFCEQFDLDDLAQRVGTPTYVYATRTFQGHYDRLVKAFAPLDPLICYSVKSCGNVHICRLLTDRGAGMDIVSGGELHRVRQAGARMGRVVYAGVGKTDAEISAALEAGIGWFNIESETEFENIATIARRMGKTTEAALRVNPDVVDPRTPAKTATGAGQTKFGVDVERAKHVFTTYGRDAHVRLRAVHLHIGSPIFSPEPYVKAIRKALDLIADLARQGVEINTLDIGGGFAADYETSQAPLAADYADQIVPLLQPFHAAGGRVILEPGRAIAANAGVLLTRVQYVKLSGAKKFVIVDSGMNHLARVALYDAYHFIWPTNVAPAHVPVDRSPQQAMAGLVPCDVVGPVCETGDFFAQDRPLPPVARGDLMCVFTAGAYGMTMASNYNGMPRPAEVLVDGDQGRMVRRRETYEDLVAAETEPEVV